MIYNLYVEKKSRRNGYGRELVIQAINEIREEGYTKVIKVKAEPTEDSIDLNDLISFYKEMGLELVNQD